ncbi:heme exporter protein CcmB [Lichenifustis flavocetrariae]|uniref:Heme exporter protein B n=1 Tax=Lichenifustis flavocetrariae TaxID=2949735 RepID=A0AA41YYK1_9HYPH|nr:heme exporter protein CcmB [Lichenifustis flavocetrariae]MCW6509592.1 heme exporter protein CcmB [Lichenifustis flavocetrariae]
MIAPLVALFGREIAVARRVGSGGLTGVMFFLALITIVPFAVGPDLTLLRRIGPAILWIAALLATLLGLDRLFQADHDDGSLDQLRMSAVPLELVVIVKCAAHWCTTGLPLVIAAPIFGLTFALDGTALASVVATLLVGTPALTLLGAIGAALTASFRRGGLLLAVITVPLAIPVLIFGVSAAAASSTGPVPFLTPFLVLCGLSLFTLAGAPFAAAAALRLTSE